MATSLKLSLTDELRAFVEENSGDGTLYSTPSEFVRDVLREKKARLDAARLREGILEGYDDVLNGRTVKFNGDVQKLLRERFG